MKVAILGATGCVGMQMLRCMEERNIKVDDLILLASENSKGRKINYLGKEYVVDVATENSFNGVDYVLGAVENAFAKKFSKAIVDSKAVFIDNSSAFRLDENVPLVIPEINEEDIKKNKGIIANPNCSTIITLMAVNPINKLSPIKKMIATTFQAVSGVGVNGIKELSDQLKELSKEDKDLKNDYTALEGVRSDLPHKAFKYQIAYNVIPAIGSFNDNLYTTEEMKMQNESRKIMHLNDLIVTCTCVRVPVMRSHSISVSVSTERQLSFEEIKNSILNSKGVKLVDDINNDKYPMPLNTCNKDIVEIGRIRKDEVLDNGIALFCSGDQIRKGAATNAVQILECLIK